jgi:CubicO group peptidase (beta-lactamase class C family)
MLDYLGQYDTEEVDPSLKAITIEHLLTMTAGFEFEPMGASSVPASLREELVSEPGEMAAYNSTSTHLLSAVVSEAAGMSALNMANDRIFSRLGIPRPIWSGDGFGVSIGGYGLNLTPRDMAKFGYLYLNEGLWDGEQIIPSSWIEMSTTKQAEWGDSALSSFADYGYLWWVLPLCEYEAYPAIGACGQIIMIVPDAEMVVVTTTDSPMTMNLVEMVMQSMAQVFADR